MQNIPFLSIFVTDMKRTITIIALLAAAWTLAAQPQGREMWNDGWSFTKDGHTKTVNLPR